MSEAPDMYPYLNNQQQFRFKNYFIAKIRERELMSKRLSKYIASFDYFDKSLFFLKQVVTFLLLHLLLLLVYL